MFKKCIIIIILVLSSRINIFSQTSEFPKIMYVKSKEGLRLRFEPSMNSDKIGLLQNGQRIKVYEKTNLPVTIDGINSYWFKTDGNYYEGKWYNSAWVFGGYLSEQLPDDVPAILGYWDVVGKSRNYYYFQPDQTYMEGYKETDIGIRGEWNLDKDVVTVTTVDYEPMGQVGGETIIIKLTVINRNNIIIKYSNGETLELIRNNGLY